MEKNDKSKTIFDNLFDPVLIYDLDGIICDLNTSAYELANKSRQIMIGTNINDYLLNSEIPIAPVKFDGDKSNIAEYITNYKFTDEVIMMECRVKMIELDGQTLIMNVLRIIDEQEQSKINLVSNDLKQKVYERTSYLEDALYELRIEIDNRIEAERALMDAKDEVLESLEKEKELGELKTRFIAMVSHEYRTPLTAILSTTYILEYLFDNQKKIDFERQLEKIQKSVKQMTAMLEDVLIVGKNEIYDVIPQYEKLDFITLCADILEEIIFIDTHNHNIVFDKSLEQLICFSDAKLIRHILKNLLTNACKYSERGSKIIISISVDDKNILLSVQDFGLGIPEEDQKRLFQPFHRSANVGTISGTGLGLSIVKRFTESLNGNICFESKVNEGTTFYLSIPSNNKDKET